MMQVVRGDMCHGWITLITTIYLLEEVNDLTCMCMFYIFKFIYIQHKTLNKIIYTVSMNTCLATFSYNKWATCLKKGIWTSKFQPGMLKVSRKP